MIQIKSQTDKMVLNGNLCPDRVELDCHDLNLTEDAFHLLKAERPINVQQLKAAASKGVPGFQASGSH